MRESLTVLTFIVILVLSAALVVPYFVDWSAQRGLVEHQLSDVLGRSVKIKGAIDLKLLPTPYLRLADAEIGSKDATRDIKVGEIQLEIAVPPLLRGEVDFVEAKLVRPQLVLTIANDTLRLGPPLQHFSGPMRFERISVEDGTLDLADPATARRYRFDAISFSAEAVSLAGPFKAEGVFGFDGQKTSFRLATGDSSADRLHIKLLLDENAQHPRADFDGDLIFAKAAASVDGQMKLSGRFADPAALPWQASGHVQGSLRQMHADDIDLRLGDEDRGASFSGKAAFDFGAKPQVHASFKTHEIDFDRLLAKSDTSALARLTQIASAFLQSGALAQIGLPLDVEASTDTAILGGETLAGISGGLSLLGRRSFGVRFEGDGPGRAHLKLAGTIEAGAAAGFKGTIATHVEDAPRLAKWLKLQLPQTGPFVTALPFTTLDAQGEATISAIGFVGQNLSLKLDQSALSGTAAYTQPVAGAPARLFADFASPHLDLDSLPDLRSFAARAKAMDLSLRLDARAVNIGSLAEAGLGQGGLATGQIRLKLDKTGDLAKLDEFDITDVGGANLHAHGQWDGKAGDFSGALDAEHVEPLAALLDRLAPGTFGTWIASRAADLGPAHLNLSAHATTSADGRISVQGFDFGGTAGATSITARIASDPKSPADLTLAAHLHAPDGLRLIKQLGLPALPLQGLGPGKIDFAAQGQIDHPVAVQALASIAGTDLTFNGMLDGGLVAPHAAGEAHLQSSGLTELLEATGLAFPDPALRLAADLKAKLDAKSGRFALTGLAGQFAGTMLSGGLTYDRAANHVTGLLDLDHLSFGSLASIALGSLAPPPSGALWPKGKFGPALLEAPPITLALSAKTFDLWPRMIGRNAAFGLDISGNRAGLKLAVQHAAMQLGTGELKGDLTLRRDGTIAAASGHVSVKDDDLALPSLRGKLSGDLDIAGTGDTPAALVGGLAGSGTLTVAGLVLPASDPGALRRVFLAVEEEKLALDADQINRTLASELDKDAAHLGNVSFDAGLAAGVLRLQPKPATPIADRDVTATLQASVDLNRLSIDQRSTLSLIVLPKDWHGSVPQIGLSTTGPINAPSRTIDSGAYLNALAARAIARESARIQAQEFDIHEQSFFYNRLKSERARTAERQKAADAARAAAIEAAKAEAEKTEADKSAPDTTEAAKPRPQAATSHAPAEVKPETPLPPERRLPPSAKVDPAKPAEPSPESTASFQKAVPLPVARPAFHHKADAIARPPLPPPTALHPLTAPAPADPSTGGY